MAAPSLYLGLISCTSVDGIDAAIVCFDDDHGACRAALRFGRTYPWDAALRTRLVALGQQDATLAPPVCSKSGRSTRHRLKAYGQRGLKAQPGGMAFSRGIEPSI